MNYKVYVHIFPNKKRYVGITQQEVNARWKNGSGYKTQPLMYRAIEKYKWHNIEHRILYTNLTELEAEQKEIELIKEWKTNNSRHGYNTTTGGEKGYCFKHTEEAKQKMREKIRGHLSEEHKEKIRQRAIGRVRTQEHIKNNSIAKWKPLYQMSLDNKVIKKWNSLKEASETLKIHKGDISRVCNGKRNIAGGYHWKYVGGDSIC